MNKILILALFALVATGTAYECAEAANQVSVFAPQAIKNIETGNMTQITNDVRYLSTLLEDVTPECNGPSGKCLSDILALIPLVNQTIFDIEAKNFTAVVQDIINLIPALEAVIQDCAGKSKPFSDIVVDRTNDQCGDDIEQLIQILPVIVKDIEAGNLTAILNDLKSLLQVVLNISKDCNFTQLEGPSGKCLSDILALIPLVNQTIFDIEAKNFTAVVQDIINLIPALEAVIQDCAGASLDFETKDRIRRLSLTKSGAANSDFIMNAMKLSEISTRFYADMEEENVRAVLKDIRSIYALSVQMTEVEVDGPSGKCLQDILNLIPLVNQTIADIEAGNFTGIIADIEALIPALKQLIQDCSGKSGFERSNDQCGDDISALIQAVPQLFKDIGDGNLTAILNDLVNLYNIVTAIGKDCNFTQLEGPSGKCLSDILALIPLVNQTIFDIEAKNFTAVVQDIINLIPALEAVIQDCAGRSFDFETQRIIEKFTLVKSPQSSGDFFVDASDLLVASKNILLAVQEENLRETIKNIRAFYSVGIAMGAYNGPSGKCLSDILAVIPIVNQTIVDIEAGNLTGIIADIQALVPAIEAVIQDCAGKSEFERTNDQCGDDIEQLIQILPVIVKDIEAGNLTAILNDLKSLLQVVLNISKDCNFTQYEGPSGKCLSDILALIPLVNQTIFDIEAKNFTAVVQDIINLIPALEAVIQDCAGESLEFETKDRIRRLSLTKSGAANGDFIVNAMKLSEISTRFYADMEEENVRAVLKDIRSIYALSVQMTEVDGPSGQCLQDILNLIPLVNQTIADIEAGNFTGIIADIEALIPALKQLIQDCSGRRHNIFAKRLNDQCGDDISALIQAVPQLFKDIGDGNLTAILNDLVNLYNIVTAIGKDCNFTLIAGPSGKCLQDILNLIPLVNQTIADIEAGNFTGIIADIEALIPALKQLVQDCSGRHKDIFARRSNDQCGDDISALIQAVPQLFKDIGDGNLTAILNDLVNLYNIVTAIGKDCNFTLITGPSGKCLQDILNLIPLVNQTIADIEAGNFTGIIADIEALIPALKQLVQDCSGREAFPEFARRVKPAAFEPVFRAQHKLLGKRSIVHEKVHRIQSRRLRNSL